MQPKIYLPAPIEEFGPARKLPMLIAAPESLSSLFSPFVAFRSLPSRIACNALRQVGTTCRNFVICNKLLRFSNDRRLTFPKKLSCPFG